MDGRSQAHRACDAAAAVADTDSPLVAASTGIKLRRKELGNMSSSEHPTIGLEEYGQRFRNAQKRVREMGLDVLLVNSHEADFANVRYFSSYWPIFEIAGV